MKLNKHSNIFALGLLFFLVFPQWSNAELEGAVKMEDKPPYQIPVEFQMRNNETSGLNFGIKLFWGLGHLVGQNDVNRDLDGNNQMYNDSDYYQKTSASGEFLPLGFGPIFGGELTLDFNSNFTIGLGASYLQFTRQSTKRVTIPSPQRSLEISMEPNISAIPLTLTIYYGIPVGEFLKVVLGAGAGYYFGKFMRSRIETQMDEQSTFTFESNANTFGAHVNLNLEFNLSHTMILIFGVSGRSAVLKDLVGVRTYAHVEPGDNFTRTFPNLTLWFRDMEQSDDKYYTDFHAHWEKPVGGSYRELRKAEISLSSLSLQIGILIKFRNLFK